MPATSATPHISCLFEELPATLAAWQAELARLDNAADLAALQARAEAERAAWLQEARRASAARAAAAQQVIDTVEAGSTVETDLGLLAYLVPKATVYWVGTSSADTDYVVIDSYFWGGNPPRDAAAWATGQSETGAVYELVLDTGGYQVAKRVR